MQDFVRMDLSVWIERRADFHPERVAVHFEGEDITYGALAERTARAAAALKHGLRVRRGDRVALLSLNSPDYLALLFACARLGAILVPLNWRLAPPEHAFILGDSTPSAILVEPEFIPGIEEIREGLGDCRPVVLGPAREGWLSWEALVAEAAGDDRNPHVDEENPLLLVYTSGTTGQPKGAVLRQSALFWNAINSTTMHDLTSADHVLSNLPMFHVGGLNIQTTPALHAGATITLHRRFDPDATLDAITARRPTLVILVPAMMQALVDHPRWVETDLSCLRMITTGSTFVPVPLIEAIHAREIPVVQVYGSTETAPIAVYLPADDAVRKIGSTGKPALHCEARIVDDQGRDVAPGERGEILLRGRNIMYEYWGNREATEEALRDGWFHTGDVGHMDEDGYYYVDERKKDMIISGSENIYPAELENVLAECPAIKESAVVARKDQRWGEIPVAVIVPRDEGAIDRDGVLGLFQGRLARYKHPRDVVFMERLPRNAMGKILKYRLRDLV
jgi:fatty-acyl-CoA synthase